MKKSFFVLIVLGQLFVNVPVVVIILGIRYIGLRYFNLKGLEGGLIGMVFGWIYWHYTIKIWVKMMINNGVERDAIVSIGRRNLLLWNKSTIDKVV